MNILTLFQPLWLTLRRFSKSSSIEELIDSRDLHFFRIQEDSAARELEFAKKQKLKAESILEDHSAYIVACSNRIDRLSRHLSELKAAFKERRFSGKDQLKTNHSRSKLELSLLCMIKDISLDIKDSKELDSNSFLRKKADRTLEFITPLLPKDPE